MRRRQGNEPASCRGNTGKAMTEMKMGAGRLMVWTQSLLTRRGAGPRDGPSDRSPGSPLLFIRTYSDLCTVTDSRQVPDSHLLLAGPGTSPWAQGQQRGRLRGLDPRSALWRREGLQGPEARRVRGKREKPGAGWMLRGAGAGGGGGRGMGARSLLGLTDGGLHPKEQWRVSERQQEVQSPIRPKF